MKKQTNRFWLIWDIWGLHMIFCLRDLILALKEFLNVNAEISIFSWTHRFKSLNSNIERNLPFKKLAHPYMFILIHL